MVPHVSPVDSLSGPQLELAIPFGGLGRTAPIALVGQGL